MALMTSDERAFARTISELAYCNPFSSDRVRLERQTLGNHYVDMGSVWSWRADQEVENPNILPIGELIRQLTDKLRQRLTNGVKASRTDIHLYGDLVLYLLYHLDRDTFQRIIHNLQSNSDGKVQRSVFRPTRSTRSRNRQSSRKLSSRGSTFR